MKLVLEMLVTSLGCLPNEETKKGYLNKADSEFAVLSQLLNFEIMRNNGEKTSDHQTLCLKIKRGFPFKNSEMSV